MYALYLGQLLSSHKVDYKENSLIMDYAIIYNYLMDLLEKDNIVGPFLVRKKQQVPYIHADILLDLTKQFKIRSYVRDPFLCLTLETEGNDENVNSHIFCNKKLSVISYKITRSVWNAFDNGFSKNGLFVRGHRDDIYELKLSPSEYRDDFVTVYALSEAVNLKIKLRILIKYTRNLQNELKQSKPYPGHILKREWLPVVPFRKNSMFEICMPHLEHEINKQYFNIVMLQRLLKHFFFHHKNLHILGHRFLEAAFYNEYLNCIRGQKEKKYLGSCYILRGVLINIWHCSKNQKFPDVFNASFNLINSFEQNYIPKDTVNVIDEVLKKIVEMNRSHVSLAYEDFFKYFELKVEPESYQVDQFGIFKSF